MLFYDPSSLSSEQSLRDSVRPTVVGSLSMGNQNQLKYSLPRHAPQSTVRRLTLDFGTYGIVVK
jgi:hypothetical protein